MPATQKRRRDQPHKVLHLSTYDRLEAYLNAFADGHLNLLILVGSGGLAKSRSVRAVLNGKACWIEGNATPFGMYAKLYRHRDQFVIQISVPVRIDRNVIDFGFLIRLGGWFARRQRHFQVVHHLRRRDDENDQQHKHQVQEWRDVQLVQRAVMRTRCFF